MEEKTEETLEEKQPITRTEQQQLIIKAMKTGDISKSQGKKLLDMTGGVFVPNNYTKKTISKQKKKTLRKIKNKSKRANRKT